MPLTDQDREMVIAQALQTEAGRVALAQAMVEPIRRNLEYQGVGRRLLMGDSYASPSYERAPKVYDVLPYSDLVSDPDDRLSILDL